MRERRKQRQAKILIMLFVLVSRNMSIYKDYRDRENKMKKERLLENEIS